MAKASVLPDELRGLMLISAIRGFGKTTLATDADFPDNIVMWDFDKNEKVVHSTKVGRYKNMLQATNDPLERCKLFLREIGELPQDQYTVAIIDNVKELENSLRVLAMNDSVRYAKKYGKDAGQVKRNTHGNAYATAYAMINDEVLEPLYAKGIQLVIATTHQRPNRDKVPGKYEPEACKDWQNLSVLTLYLVSGDKFPIPSAVVWKEATATIEAKDSTKFSAKEVEAIKRGEKSHRQVRRMLPQRIPEATFEKIRWYYQNPADFDNPAPGETNTKAELEPFTREYTDDQIAIHLLSLKAEEKEQEELQELISAEMGAAKERIAEAVKERKGKSPPVIRNEIQALIDSGELEYEGEVSIGMIAGMR